MGDRLAAWAVDGNAVSGAIVLVTTDHLRD
jgi:hypothetical protein